MSESKVQLVILYIFIGVWISVIVMVICTLCLARHLYTGEEDTLFFELREAEIKDNVILKRVVKRAKKKKDRTSTLISSKRKSIRNSIHSHLSIDTSASEQNCCHICLDDFKQGDIVSQSRNNECTHTFHEACITEWLMVPHDSCPVCRNAFIVGHHHHDDRLFESLEDGNRMYASNDVATRFPLRPGRYTIPIEDQFDEVPVPRTRQDTSVAQDRSEAIGEALDGFVASGDPNEDEDLSYGANEDDLSYVGGGVPANETSGDVESQEEEHDIEMMSISSNDVNV